MEQETELEDEDALMEAADHGRWEICSSRTDHGNNRAWQRP